MERMREKRSSGEASRLTLIGYTSSAATSEHRSEKN